MPTQRERERSVRHADRARVRTKRQSVGTTGARFSYVTAPSRDSWSTARLTPVDTVQDVLMRRRQEAETTAGLKRFRNDRSFDTMYTSRLYGIVLLLLGLMNVSLFSLLQWRRGFQAECTFVVPDRSPLGNDRWVRPITKQDCSGDLVRFQKAEKLYVYYSIFNYPFHGAAVFRLHSQKQMQGRSVSRDQTEACYPFNVVKVRGKEKVIHPCGAHIWNIYNDTFKFSSENPNVSPHYIPLDESVELLGYQQEYRDSRNPTQHDVLHTHKNTYHWLLAETLMVERDSVRDDYVDSGEPLYLTNKTASSLKAIYSLMGAPGAGQGLENGHIIQWMTPPPFKSFKKLYGVLTGPVSFPFYVSAHIAYEADQFGGWKTVSIVAPSWPYGKLMPLQTLFAVLSIACILMAMPMLLTKPGNPFRKVNLI